MKFADRSSIANALLAALPRTDYRRLQANLEPVTLAFGEVLYEPGDLITHVYFPNDSLVSLLSIADQHLALEVGMVGHEGMVGIDSALGITAASFRTLVQGTGTAMRMKTTLFYKEFHQCPPLHKGVLLYAHDLLIQVAKTAACNRFHVIEARLARWLLMMRDRARTNHFHLTHEFLAHMLGVRRVGVTNAAHTLKQRRLIDYSRGNIAIIDGPGLERASCSCYPMIKDR